jgi:hypothetical protein
MTFSFDPASDRYRPLFWDEIDPSPAPIEITLNPRTVLRNKPITTTGTVQTPVDPGIEFSVAGGHVDIAAEQAQLEEQKRRNSGR